MLVECMNLKKTGKLFTSKFVGTGPSSYKKKNLPGRGLTKVEKHWCKPFQACSAITAVGLSMFLYVDLSFFCRPK